MPKSSANRARIAFFALVLHISAIALTILFLGQQILDLLGGSQSGVSLQMVIFSVSARIVAVGLLVYIGIASLRNIPWKHLAWAHLIWFLIFTWYGWFSSGAPFIIREIDGTEHIGRAWLLQEFILFIRFAVIAFIYSGIPLWLLRKNLLKPLAELRPRLFRILRVFSIVIFFIWFGLTGIATRVFTVIEDPVFIAFGLLLAVSLVSAALCAAAKQRRAFLLLTVESLLAPFVRFFSGIR